MQHNVDARMKVRLRCLNRYAYVRGEPLRATDPTGNTSIGGDDPDDPYGDLSYGAFGFSSGFGSGSVFGSSWSFEISSWSFSNWNLFDSSSSRGSLGASKMLFESMYYAEDERDRKRESQGEQRTELFSFFGGAIRVLPKDVENPGQAAGVLQGGGLVLGGLGARFLGQAVLGAISRPALISLGAGLPPAVQSAGPKLADLAARFGTTRTEPVRNALQTGSRFADVANKSENQRGTGRILCRDSTDDEMRAG